MTQIVFPIDAGLSPRVRSLPRKTLKVLHVVNGQHYAGAERVQDLLAMSLPAWGYEVSFACVLPDRFEADRISQSAALYNLPMKHRMDVGPVRKLASLIRSEGFDLLHSHTTRSAMLSAAAAKLTGIPYLHHVHCQMSTEVNAGLKVKVNARIEKMACHCADHAIAVSESIQRFMKTNGFNRSPVTVVPNGVPAAAELKPLRQVGQPWTIGMVALLRERKGLETLLNALPVLREVADVRLRIVGSFESDAYRNQMYALVDELGIGEFIDWTGFTHKVIGEVAQMDLLVLPSVLAEGMPMVLLEAMSAGVPIVGSNVDGITDVIRHQKNGLLFDSGNAASLSEQLIKIIRSEIDWEGLRSECLRDYELRFSCSAMAAGVASVYDEVLKARANA